MMVWRTKMIKLLRERDRYEIALKKIRAFGEFDAPYRNLVDCIEIASEALEEPKDIET